MELNIYDYSSLSLLKVDKLRTEVFICFFCWPSFKGKKLLSWVIHFFPPRINDTFSTVANVISLQIPKHQGKVRECWKVRMSCKWPP